MLKKLLSLVLCIFLISSNISNVKADSPQYSGMCGDNAYWKIENDVMTISGTGKISSSPWKNGGDDWITEPKQLIIESGITEIGDKSFSGPVRLDKGVLFKDGISLPDTLKIIGEMAFNETACRKVVIPDSVEQVGDDFFSSSSLEEIVINGKMKTLGKWAFWWDSELKKVTINAPLETLGEGVFSKCYNLEEIQLPSTLKDLGKETFFNCKSLKKVVVPEGVKTILERTFMRCISLESVTLPSTLETIEKEAFVSCNHMVDCSLPSGVTSIGEGAFSYCASLKQITVPEGASFIGKKAFKDCYALKDIKLPEGMQEIPEGLLSGCASLKKFSFPEHTVSIGKDALTGCNSLKKIVIPQEVTELKTFEQDCPHLKKIVNRSNVPYSLSASKLVKTWYRGKKKVNVAGAGQTVTARNKTFRITFKNKLKGVRATLCGRLKKTYQYGESVKLPKVKLTDEQYYQCFFMGWNYNANQKKYETGRQRTYFNTLVDRTDNGVKGDITVDPVVLLVHAKKNKKNQLVVKMQESVSAGRAFANAYEVELANPDYYSGSARIGWEARYATNAKMKNAVNLGYIEKYGRNNIITKIEKGKSYYMQIRAVAPYHSGVPQKTFWSPVVKLKVKNK